MVLQQDNLEEKEIIKDLDKEILILRNLGIEDYEIKYLMILKKKREAGLKWKG